MVPSIAIICLHIVRKVIHINKSISLARNCTRLTFEFKFFQIPLAGILKRKCNGVHFLRKLDCIVSAAITKKMYENSNLRDIRRSSVVARMVTRTYIKT